MITASIRRALATLGLSLLAACGARESALPPAPRTAPKTAVTALPDPPKTAEPVTADSPPPPEGAPTGEDAERVLFLATHLRTDGLRRSCPVTLERDARVRCLIALRYEAQDASRELALTLYTETGSLAGLLPEETYDDGRGGEVHLMPARPIGPYREHLSWIIDAFRDYRRFAKGLAARGGKVTFEDRPLHFRFFTSEKGGHPSAFAVNRNVGYNLYGVLNVSDDAVRDTLFHEIFHLNDTWHEGWSARALLPLFEHISARCGKKNACFAPYSPTDTRMGGRYYAFSPQSGAKEYAAELALRYYREHRLILEGKPLPVSPFKCGPPENQQAWKLVADEFFGGVDLVPACP